MSDHGLVNRASEILDLVRAYEKLPSEQRLHSPLRDQLCNSVDVFQNELRGPVELVSRNETYYVHLLALQAIYRFQVPANVPRDRAISYAELATLCSVNQSILERIVRFAICSHIFAEPRRGFVEHNDASKALLDIQGCNEVLGIVAETLWPAATKTVDALIKWPNSEEPNESGFNIALSTDVPFNQWIGSDPTRIMRFGSAMKFLVTERVLNCNNQTVVDIGGGSGAVAKMILARSETVHCIVQDIPKVIESCSVPTELHGRLTFQPHDFFQAQPAAHADAYLLRNVLHNWSDKYALRILKALVPAMKPGARILVHECCVPKHGHSDTLRERSIRSYDIGMLSLLNGKERDEEGWLQLFSQADQRFRFIAVHSFPSSFASLVEFTWTE